MCENEGSSKEFKYSVKARGERIIGNDKKCPGEDKKDQSQKDSSVLLRRLDLPMNSSPTSCIGY